MFLLDKRKAIGNTPRAISLTKAYLAAEKIIRALSEVGRKITQLQFPLAFLSHL